MDDVELVVFRGLRINVWHLYDTLTALGWKVDTKESNLMVAMSRTWRAEGIKVWLHLAGFVCAPPEDQVECLDRIRFYRFDPAAMPTETMFDRLYDPGDQDAEWFPAHRAEWAWLVENGDPQTDTFELLKPLALREVPRAILDEAWMEIEEAIEPADG
jgi:hypothetical protein